MESLGRQHPAAEGYIVKTWWAMRENGLAQAGEYAKAQDRARRGGLFAAELQSAAPALANPDTPEQTRQAMRAELARKTRGIFADAASPRLVELERFTARQDELAQEARGQRHQERVFAELSALPEAEAQARLASPQGRRALALSGSQANALSGMLRVKHGFDAEQREERKNAYVGRLAEKLGDLFRADAAPVRTGQIGEVGQFGQIGEAGQADRTGGAASQGREAPPVAAYRLVLGADIAPEIKDVAVARIMDGSFGKKDDPEVKAALMSGLAAGTLKPHAVDEAALLGSLTPQTVDGLREFAKSLAGEDGIYIAQGFAALQRRMPQDASPRQLAKAQEFLQHQLARAAKAGRLAEALNPDNADNAVDRAVRLSGTEFHSLGEHLAEVPGAIIHGGVKGVNAAIALAYEAADYLNEKGWLEGHYGLNDEDGGPIFVNKAGKRAEKDRFQLPNLPAPETASGKMAAGISQFLTGFKGVEKLLKGIKAASLGTSVAKGLVTSFAADFAFFDGQETRLSNLIQSHPALANPVTGYLSAKPGDGRAEGRLKNALEGLGLGAAAEGLLYGLRLTKAGRELTQRELRAAEDAKGAQKKQRAAIKEHNAEVKKNPIDTDGKKRPLVEEPRSDYTDYRSPDTMHFAAKELSQIIAVRLSSKQ